LDLGRIDDQLGWSYYANCLASCLLFAWSLALLPLRLRRPRPRRPLGRAGSVVCWAVPLGSAYEFVRVVTVLLGEGPNAQIVGRELFTGIFTFQEHSIPLAVASGWLAMAFRGRRRPGRDWIDFFGIALGAGWLLQWLGLSLSTYWG
jgi:hypothetical protein